MNHEAETETWAAIADNDRRDNREGNRMSICQDFDRDAGAPCTASGTETTPSGRDLCTRHANAFWALRERTLRDYPDSDIAPAWFNPTDAGETW